MVKLRRRKMPAKGSKLHNLIRILFFILKELNIFSISFKAVSKI
jgi:hypothetical protein